MGYIFCISTFTPKTKVYLITHTAYWPTPQRLCLNLEIFRIFQYYFNVIRKRSKQLSTFSNEKCPRARDMFSVPRRFRHNLWGLASLPSQVEVERAGAQLVFWLELGELSQLGSAQLTILNLLASSAQLSSPFWSWKFSSAQLSSPIWQKIWKFWNFY